MVIMTEIPRMKPVTRVMNWLDIGFLHAGSAPGPLVTASI
jgi:hypothetical protein